MTKKPPSISRVSAMGPSCTTSWPWLRRKVVAALGASLLTSDFDRARAEREILPPLRAAAEQLSGLAPSFLAPVL